MFVVDCDAEMIDVKLSFECRNLNQNATRRLDLLKSFNQFILACDSKHVTYAEAFRGLKKEQSVIARCFNSQTGGHLLKRLTNRAQAKQTIATKQSEGYYVVGFYRIKKVTADFYFGEDSFEKCLFAQLKIVVPFGLDDQIVCWMIANSEPYKNGVVIDYASQTMWYLWINPETYMTEIVFPVVDGDPSDKAGGDGVCFLAYPWHIAQAKLALDAIRDQKGVNQKVLASTPLLTDLVSEFG